MSTLIPFMVKIGYKQNQASLVKKLSYLSTFTVVHQKCLRPENAGGRINKRKQKINTSKSNNQIRI